MSQPAFSAGILVSDNPFTFISPSVVEKQTAPRETSYLLTSLSRCPSFLVINELSSHARNRMNLEYQVSRNMREDLKERCRKDDAMMMCMRDARLSDYFTQRVNIQSRVGSRDFLLRKETPKHHLESRRRVTSLLPSFLTVI